MATQIGAVVYEDNIVWRIVLPLPHEGDEVLDDPQWTELGADPGRAARLVKLDARTPDWSQFRGIRKSIAGFASGAFKEIP